MDAAIATLATLAGLIVGGALVIAALELNDRRGRWAKRRGTRVLVNLKSGNAINGILVRRTRSYLTVVDAQVFERGVASPSKADGEVIIEVIEVDFYQFI